MNVIAQVGVLFLLMMAGLLAAKTKLLDSRQIAGISTFVLYFAMTCLNFVKLQREANAELIKALAQVFVVALCTMIALGGLTYLIFRREPEKRRGVLSSLAAVSNCGFMGYPVVTAAFGDDKLIYAVIYVAAFTVFSWTGGAMMFEGRKGVSLKRLATTPSLIGVLLGIVCFLAGLRMPDMINQTLELIGATTTPLAMFVIGAQLSGLRLAHLKDKGLLVACGLRLIAFPLAVLLVVRLLPLEPWVGDVVFLCSAMPGAALTAIQAGCFHSDEALASRGVAITSALSCATIPLMLLLLQTV